MSHSRTGIPTLYQHCQFRSRLEAKWATFFDLLGWKWEYDPFDLNGWIPDFLLIGATFKTMVEIKPFTSFEEFDSEKIIRSVGGNISGSWPEKNSMEILLLGCTLPDGHYQDRAGLGWLLQYDPIVTGIYSDLALFNKGYTGDTCTKIGFRADCGSYADRITGDGGSHPVEPDIEEIQALWRQAGNNTQWQPN